MTAVEAFFVNGPRAGERWALQYPTHEIWVERVAAGGWPFGRGTHRLEYGVYRSWAHKPTEFFFDGWYPSKATYGGGEQ